VLDSAALVVTTIKGIPRGQAEIVLRVGAHLVEDISNFIAHAGDGSTVAHDDFAAVHARLAAAGYEVEPLERSWRAFERVRRTYAGRLDALAEYWATPAPSWGGNKVPGTSPAHDA
jgi:hypothetical protein